VYVNVYTVVKLLPVILLNISVITCYNLLVTINVNK